MTEPSLNPDLLYRARFVMLPGLDGSGLLFRPWLEVMPDAVHRQVFAYPPDRLLGYDELAQWVADRIEGEPDEPLVLVGESFGGPLALRVAAAMGDRVQAVVLVATFGRSPMWPWLCRALALPVRLVPPWRWILRLALGDRTTPPALLDLAQEALARTDRRVLAGRVREVAAVQSDALLQALPVPLMYIQAKRDRLVGPGSLERLRRVRPDLHAVTFDAPHLVTQHQPEATWQAVKAWLGSLA